MQEQANWEALWKNQDMVQRWKQPDLDVMAIVPLLRKSGIHRVLDLGAGLGRHTVFFAQQGLDVDAVEITQSGADTLRQELANLGLRARIHQCNMTDIGRLFEPSSIGLIVCWNVLYHARIATMIHTLELMRNCLMPSGYCYLTFNSLRNKHYGKGTELEPNTFIGADGKKDADHIHHYSDRAEVVRLMNGFDILELTEKEETVGGRTFANAFHWYVLARKLAD